MMNATASLLPLLTVGSGNGFYYNVSTILYTITSTINHLFPENLGGMTHLVKLLLSNILFSLIGLDPQIGIAISFIDLSPLFLKNQFLMKLGELAIQIPRLLIELKLLIIMYTEKEHTARVVIIVLAKLIYFWERHLRIKRNERNNFYFFHFCEHLGLYIILCSLTTTYLFNIFHFLGIFLCFIVFWCVFIFSITAYFYRFYEQRVPHYIKENDQMMEILSKKLKKNFESTKIHNYICKPWTTHLKMEIITWSKIERCCEEIVAQMNTDEIDYVVGIATGGVFIAACIGKLINKPVKIINSKLWSGISFYENYVKVRKFFAGEEVKPSITGIPEIEGKRILLCDDTTYTGLTMMNCKDWALNVCKAKEVKTAILWIHHRFIPDYYISQRRVPIIWEWGAEMD